MGYPSNELVSLTYTQPVNAGVTGEAEYVNTSRELMDAMLFAMENRLPFPFGHSGHMGVITNIDFDRRHLDVTTLGSIQPTYLVQVSVRVTFVLLP